MYCSDRAPFGAALEPQMGTRSTNKLLLLATSQQPPRGCFMPWRAAKSQVCAGDRHQAHVTPRTGKDRPALAALQRLPSPRCACNVEIRATCATLVPLSDTRSSGTIQPHPLGSAQGQVAAACCRQERSSPHQQPPAWSRTGRRSAPALS